MVVYAKSDGTTLTEHTKDLLKRLDDLKLKYGTEIINTVPSNHRKNFWECLDLICKFHDIGKINSHFQYFIQKKMGNTVSKNNDLPEIPHNLLSPSFMISAVQQFPEDVKNLLLSAVAFHHARNINAFVLDDRDWKAVIDVVSEDLTNKISEASEFAKDVGISIALPPKSNYLRRIQPWKECGITSENERMYLMLKGLLHRLDHSASSQCAVEVDHVSRDNNAAVIDYLTNKKKVPNSDIWQVKAVDGFCGTNVILEAGTGCGKTEFSLFWAGNRKCFYTLPVRTSVNAMYQRLKETFNVDDAHVGLLHSDAVFYLYDSIYDDSESKNYVVDAVNSSILARQLSAPITVSTADQLFTAVFRYHGFEKIYSTLAYSTVIVDEIQSYDPDMVAVILKGLTDIALLGGKFCLMTATLPDIYMNTLKDKLGADVVVLPERFNDIKRHRMKICDSKITEPEVIKLIKNLANEYPKVLVIANTVHAAQELFSALSDMHVKATLLHSGYTQNDRKNREREILSESATGVWITTQLVEVSVDIDFPVMVTELSTIDSLIQRMGRVRRRDKNPYDSDKPNIFVCIGDKPSGIGAVYDQFIFEESRETLLLKGNVLLSPKDERNMIKEVFSSDKFEKSQYKKQFDKSWRLLNELEFRVNSKSEAQTIFRKMSTHSFIPVNVYKANMLDIQKWIREIEAPDKNFGQKLDPISKMRSLTVSINSYKAKDLVKEPLGETGFYIGNLEYDQNLGISTKHYLMMDI